jgi:hypothetical protein
MVLPTEKPMNEKPIPINDTVSEAALEELQKELWKYGAVIHDRNYKKVDNGIVAIINLNPKLKELAYKFDGAEEKIDVRDVKELRGKLHLVFKNGRRDFLVYGKKGASRISDEIVEVAYGQIGSEGQFASFSKEMEKMMTKEGDKGVFSQ